MTTMTRIQQTRTLPTIVNPPTLPDTRQFGYSTAAITAGSGRLAHVSGQTGMDRTGGIAPDFATQVDQAYANLVDVIEALGATPDQVVKLTLYVVDHNAAYLGILGAAVARVFGDLPPAQTLVGVQKLALDPLLFEVEAIVQLD